MDINVYLPDELGQKAKAEGLNFSGLLRMAVNDELRRRKMLADTVAKSRVYELRAVDDEGNPYVGRLTGTLVHEAEGGLLRPLGGKPTAVYLTDDDRIFIHASEKLIDVTNDPAEALRHYLVTSDYRDAMHALGLTPTIDI